MKKKVFSIIFILIFDVAAFYLSLYFAYYLRLYTLTLVESYLREYYPRFPLDFPFQHLVHFWWMPVSYFMVFIFEKLYTLRLPYWEEVRIIIKSISLAIFIILGILFIGQLTSRTSSVAIAYLYFLSVLIFPMFRLFGKKFLRKLDIWNEKLIIIGDSVQAQKVAEAIEEESHIGYSIEGIVKENKGETPVNRPYLEKYKILGTLSEIDEILKKTNIKNIVVAISQTHRKKHRDIIANLQRKVEKLFFVPDVQGVALLNTKLYYFFMQELFLIKIVNNLHFTTNKIIKRLFDILICIFIFPFFLPLFIIISILIKIDSKGPVLFGHMRVGQDGKPIKVYKFRSMYADAEEKLREILASDEEARKEWETYFKLKKDPRITKIGKFLRKTSLDELPQIFNVILGNMSIVGPRPVVKPELEKYYKNYLEYYTSYKPGITGLWQVSGRNEVDYGGRVKLDTWYILNWSLWLDIIIMFKTIKAVLRREGAY